jgi:thioredoxin 1
MLHGLEIGAFDPRQPPFKQRNLKMASDAVKEFTDDNFDAEVLQSSGPVLVDFWAPWCGPCRQIAPMIDELASENPSIKIGKLNIDDNPSVPQRFGISSIPTLLVFKGGEIAESFVGVRPKAALQQALDSVGA